MFCDVQLIYVWEVRKGNKEKHATTRNTSVLFYQLNFSKKKSKMVAETSDSGIVKSCLDSSQHKEYCDTAFIYMYSFVYQMSVDSSLCKILFSNHLSSHACFFESTFFSPILHKYPNKDIRFLKGFKSSFPVLKSALFPSFCK